jgi:hypothetical protein
MLTTLSDLAVEDLDDGGDALDLLLESHGGDPTSGNECEMGLFTQIRWVNLDVVRVLGRC